jgi:xanthine/uracil/vitamin C permease (AzgA family)
LYALVSSLGFIDEKGDFPKSQYAFSADALATMFGSIFGLSPVTSYIESATGVEAGSRTGLTAVMVAFYFFLSIFFAPIIASIPPWATGGCLIVVGALMSRSLAKIKWYNITHAVTAFVTVIIMPLTYSIAYGLIAGICVYGFMECFFKLAALAGIPEPTFEPPDEQMMLNEEKLIASAAFMKTDEDIVKPVVVVVVDAAVETVDTAVDEAAV